MTHRAFPRFGLGLVAAATLVVAAACGDSLGLPPPGVPNEVDTLTLYALRGTAIATPSGFDVVNDRVTRTDQGQAFDLAFDIDSTGTALILPAGVLGLETRAGVLASTSTFDELRRAPETAYTENEALPIATGDVFVVRSRPSDLFCGIYFGALPRYGKFHVLDLDPVERTVTLEALVNVNCGYRSLEPGLPAN